MGRRRGMWLLGIAGVLSAWAAGAGTPGHPPVRRAAPPQFDRRATAGIFFDNLFSKLSGSPPQPVVVGVSPASPAASSDAAATAVPGSASGEVWSQLVSSTTLEDEIKATKSQLDQAITTPVRFASQDYQAARRHFHWLATLFGVIAEYGGEVRWRKEAISARILFARTAANCKVGSPAAFNDAKNRKAELADLMGGNGLTVSAGEWEPDWSELADRGGLMQRLEAAWESRLRAWSASTTEFQARGPELLHEAEVVAVIAEVLRRPGLDDSDDEDYRQLALRLREAARHVVESVKAKDAERGRQAGGAVMKACSACHELYRG